MLSRQIKKRTHIEQLLLGSSGGGHRTCQKLWRLIRATFGRVLLMTTRRKGVTFGIRHRCTTVYNRWGMSEGTPQEEQETRSDKENEESEGSEKE